MSDILQVALVQTDLIWENADQNRKNLERKISGLDADLVVLPEMFTSGFTMEPEHVAETMDGETLSWLKMLAKKKEVAITGSLVIKEGADFFNRMVFVQPNGQVDHYDKRHTFTLVGEDKIYTAGIKKIIIDYKGWKISPLVCYDLRFPVWSRNSANYDLVLYVASWPEARMEAWDTLLKARAIENMAYCVGVNRVGKDGNNHDYSGNSAAYDVLGKRLDHIPKHEEAIEIVRLDKKDLQKNRSKFNFLADQDQFSIT